MDDVHVIGRPCNHCNGRIVSLLDGTACTKCDAPLHVDEECWSAHFHEHHPETPFRSAPARPPKRLLADRPCRHEDRLDVGRTFLGFRRTRCTDCQVEAIAPLTRRRKITYWVVLSAIGIVMLGMLFMGWIPIPGVLTILLVYALVRNRDVEAAQFARALKPRKKKKSRARGMRPQSSTAYVRADAS